MKTITYLISIIAILCTAIFAQSVSNEVKTNTINNLESFHYNIKLDAAIKILNEDIPEALPKLEQLISKQDSYIALLFLKGIKKYGSSNTLTLAHWLFNVLDTLNVKYQSMDRLLAKVEVTDILFQLNDYSTVKSIFDLIENKKPLIATKSLFLLEDVMKHVPQFSFQAKQELIRIANINSDNSGQSYYALNRIVEYFPDECLPILEYVFVNHQNSANRRLALDKMKLFKYNKLIDLIKKRIDLDDAVTIRLDLAKLLLTNYVSLENYDFVKKYFIKENNELVKYSLISDLNSFISPKPDNLIKISQLLDTLISYTNQCKNYGWLGDNNYTNELVNKITSAKNYLTSLDSINCAKAIKSFQSSINIVYSDSVGSYPKYVSKDAYKFLYYYPQYILDRLPAPYVNVKLVNSNGSILSGGSLQYYDGGWKNAINNNNGTFSIDTKLKTISLKMTYAYGSQTLSNVTVGKDTIKFQTVNSQVKLQNSIGNPLDQGTVQYYSGAWRDFGTTTGGTVSKELLPENYSFRMTYAYASNDKSQDIGVNSTVIFQTVNAQVQLKNSLGNLIDQGTVQYYSGAWRSLGTTTNGIASMELLSNNYSFRMTYGFASNDKAQEIGVNSTVVFQTVNAQVQLKNSLGNLIDQGTVQYYSGAWRSLGNTINGVASMELLPNNYSFRMTYAFASNDKQQNIGANSTVVFQTVNAQVQMKNSLGSLIDQGTVQYYSGAWRNFGTTTNGISTLELLPNSYSFRMTYAFASNDKQQDIGTNSTVVFQTINAQVQLKNSLGNFIDQGTVQYYSGAWRNLGTTTNGIATIELLPNTYSFRMTYGFISKDISQNIALNNVITYSTVLCTVKVNNSQNQPVNNADIKYYSGAWREIGLTSDGVITKELLPANLSFRVNYNSTQKDITQDISLNNIVVFGL